MQEPKLPNNVILSAAKDLSPDRDPSLRSELALRNEGMTRLHRLGLTGNTSYLKWIAPCGGQARKNVKRTPAHPFLM